MKRLLKKFNSLFMIMLLLMQTFSPYMVKAAEGDPLIGQLKLPGSTEYTDRVEVIEGDTLTGNIEQDRGKVQVKKIVRAATPSDPGYKADGTAFVVEFQIKGVPYENTKNAYVVLVFDRSGSMICDGDRESYSEENKNTADGRSGPLIFNYYNYCSNWGGCSGPRSFTYNSFNYTPSTAYTATKGDGTTIYCSHPRLTNDKQTPSITVQTDNVYDVYNVKTEDIPNVPASGVLANKWESAVDGGKTFSTKILQDIPTSYVSLVTFSSSANNATAFSRNAFNYSDFAHPYGGTALAAGINNARTALSSSSIKQNDEKVIVIISDGEPTVPSGSAVSNAKTAADNAKNAGITIYTIGYQVAASTESYATLTENSAAESVLKNLASKDSNNNPYYFAATSAESLNPIFTSIANKITETFNAGSNPQVNDNLGSAFSISAGSNQLSYTGVIPEEWTTVGSFTMAVNPDAADENGGWKNTNNGFSLTYDTPNKDSNGNTITRTITVPVGDDPLVYWPQRTYSYRVEYYYENLDNLGTYTHDTSLDVTYNDRVTLGHGDDVEEVLLHLGTDISVPLETINDSTHKKTGYIFDSSNSNQHISAQIVNSYDTNANVLKVYYDLEPLTYIVKHFKQNATGSEEYTEVTSDEQTINIKYGQTATYANNSYEGYTYQSDKDEKNKDTLVVTDNELVISLYYDIEQYDYQIIYHYTNDDDVTETGTKDYGETVSVTDQMINDHMLKGYKLRDTDPVSPASRQITIKTNTAENVIHVYYVADPTQTKNLEYIVEYYKDNVLVSSDTKTYGITVQELEPSTMTVNKTEINTTNKYDGYVFDHSNPETIPDTVTTGTTIKIYYVRDRFDYTIEYYYDGTRDDQKTETGTALFNEQISSYTDNLIDGYKLEKTENYPLTISSNAQNNVMKIYYVKDSFGYAIEYYYDGTRDDQKTETGTALFGSQISGYEDKVIAGYKLDHVTNNPINITSTAADNVMKVYYVRDSFGYRVEYYYENVLDESKTETGTALFNDRITTYNDKVETGYELDKTEGLPLTIGTNANNNVIKVYYKLRVCDYSIDYYYDGTKDSNETINATAKYGSQINTYENKIRDGYKLQKTENLPLTVGLNASENVINVYYVKDNFGYTIEYYYDGENDPEKTETGTAEFESRISSYPDKNITGYKLDKTENFPLTITSDPQNNLIKVYYVKDSFGYSIEYYYDETKDDSKTVTGTAEFGSQITEYEDKVIDGYKFDKVENKPLTITNTATSNVMKVYYVKDSFGYSIEYYYDGTKDDSKTVTGTAEFASQITEYEDKVIDGYKFDKVENKPLTITNIATSNVMKVYYVKDSFGYSIEYYYENVKDDQKTETGTAEFDSQITNYTDKNIEGYKLDKTENLPLTIKSDPTKNIIKIYYIIDDGNTKKLEYFVEYYKDNVLVSSDTDHETLEVQILEPNDIPVLKDKINTTNKYDGYKFDHTDPSTIPDAIYTGSTIKVYYVKDNFAYSIEYYYDGTKDDSKTETGTALFESQITSYTDKIIEGYKLDKVENKPLTITSNKDDNIMKVYYVKDTFQYKVEYYYENVKDDSKTETGYAIFRDVITNYTDKLETGYELDKTENLPLTITSTSANNVIKVYYKLKVCAYTINYYYDDVKDDSKTVTDSAKYGTKIETYTEQLKDGYKFSHDENVPLIIGLEENNNVINVYYVRDNFAYTIEYYYENVKDDSKTESGTALFNSVIDTYTDNLIKGYRLDKEENYPLTITSNKDNNVMKIYYVIDETQTDDIAYTVEYYKDNVIVSSDTQTVGKTVQVLDDHILDVIKEDINLIDKYVGYSYDHFEIITPSTKRMLKATKAPETLPDTVVDGTVIRVYYVINEYDYDVEYYLQDTDGNYQLNSEAGYTEEGVTYGTKTKFENKTFEHYTLNENKTENNDIEVTEDGIVVKVYYDLDKANIIVHYVVSDVDDGHYTLFSEFGVDDEGNVIEPFVGLDLEDADLDGYIGAKTTLKGRKPVEYNFLGVYLNDELVSESEDFEVEFEEETKEYIYVYQAPAGDIPPHTGIDDEVNNSSIFGIISIITVMSTGMYFLRREEN